MNLGDLITALEAADQNITCTNGFTNPHSYRGDYMDLAFEPATDVPVRDMLAAAQAALDTTYTGYKGGEFNMTADTWCWLSAYGDASGETLSPLSLQAMLTQPTADADRDAEIRTAAFKAAALYVRGHSADERYGKASISTALCAVSDALLRMAAETQQAERVKHSGPEAELCVLCLSGEHERVADEAQQAGQGR